MAGCGGGSSGSVGAPRTARTHPATTTREVSTVDALSASLERVAKGQLAVETGVGPPSFEVEDTSCDGREPHFRCQLELAGNPDNPLDRVELGYEVKLFPPGITRCWIANLRSARHMTGVAESRRIPFRAAPIGALSGCYVP